MSNGGSVWYVRVKLCREILLLNQMADMGCLLESFVVCIVGKMLQM